MQQMNSLISSFDIDFVFELEPFFLLSEDLNVKSAARCQIRFECWF